MTSYEDRYFYPGTEVFINHYGIRSAKALEDVETEITHTAAKNLPDVLPLNEAGLKATHKALFERLYPWAGQYRKESIQKVGTDARFTEGSLVASKMRTFFQELDADMKGGQFSGLKAKDFAYRAAVYTADLNRIHPFPDGNGRLQRMFLNELAGRSGFSVDQRTFTRTNWIGAMRDADKEALFNARSELVGMTEKAQLPRLIDKSLTPLSQQQVRDRRSLEAAAGAQPTIANLVRGSRDGVRKGQRTIKRSVKSKDRNRTPDRDR